MGTSVIKRKATKRRKSYKIPFNADGNMMHYADDYYTKPATWVDPAEFQDTLKFLRFEKGNRSGAWAWYESVLTGRRYCVTLGELSTFIEKSVVAGVVAGVFDYVKRGQNYTLTFVRSLFDIEKVDLNIPGAE